MRCVAPIQTTITFDGNGNDGGEMAKQKIDANATAPLRQNTFVKDGYAFTSWNTERDGSGTSYVDEQDYTAGEWLTNVTLYAQWNPVTTITFDGNRNDGGEMSKQRIAQNTTAPLNQNKFTKDGYAFASWNTERDGSGTSYADGQDFAVGEGINNVTLYAQWREPAAISDLTYMQDFATLSEGDKVGVLNSMTEE